MKPVNKQSALFLSRKPRIETIAEALEKFAVDVTGPQTASKIKEMLYKAENGEDAEVTISIKIRPDMKAPGLAIASIDSRVTSRMGTESFFGLA